MRDNYECKYPLPKGVGWFNDGTDDPGAYCDDKGWWLGWVEQFGGQFNVIFDRHRHEPDSTPQAPEEKVPVSSLDEGLKYLSTMLMMGFR